MNSIPASNHVVTVRSPEGVELELPVAGPSSRVAAYAIDLIFVSVLIFGVFVVVALTSALSGPLTTLMGKLVEETASTDKDLSVRAAAYLLALFMVVVYFGELAYFSFWELVSRGRSPGKYLMRLRVIGSEGQPATARAILIRNVLRAVDTLPATYAFGLVAMIVSQRTQRLGDHAAGTLVIRTDRLERPAAMFLPPDIRPLALSREQLSRLGERELGLLRSTLRRIEPGKSHGSVESDRALAAQVAQTLARRLKLEDAGGDPVRLLQQLLVTVAPHELERAERSVAASLQDRG